MKSDCVDRVLDATGLYCPEPIMLLHNTMGQLSAGDIVLVKATDPSTARDIPKFCKFLGHELIETRVEDEKYSYLLRKGSSSSE